ncbi:MAG: preprotein translocase subunit YajC [Microbacteriaceae bacterium]
MPEDIFQYVLLALLAVGIFFLFRSSRKNKQRQEELKSQIVPGVEVMTNFGLFGTLLSVDELSNVAELETSPGNVVRVHRQTIAKVVEPTEGENAGDEPRSVEEAMERANREYEAKNAPAVVEDAPEFGERVAEIDTPSEVDTVVEPAKKTASRPSKKTGE